MGTVLLVSTGCIHPNIPSYRAESGGLFPPPQSQILHDGEGVALDVGQDPLEGGLDPAMLVDSTESEAIGFLEEPCDCHGNEECGMHDVRGREPNVPWPKFHPLPVRPVF